MSNGENPFEIIAKSLNVLSRLEESKQLPDDIRNEIVQLGDKMLLGSMRSLSTVLAAAFDRMDARAEEREKPLATPWPDFNAQLPGGGFWPGCHLLVSGTGVGKSMWALQFALHTAREGGAVIYAGLELDAFQVARATGVDSAAAATHLRAAVNALDDLIGVVTPDDVLDRVFQAFCVGK